MGNRMHHDPLEALLHAARRDEPDAIDDVRANALVQNAMKRAKVRRSMRLVITTGSMVTLAAAAAVLLTMRSASVPAPEVAARTTPAPVVAALPTMTRAGDRLHGTPRAAFTLADDDGQSRRIVLERGAVLCDVAPLTGAQSFEVVADDVRVHVRGTVFSVEREATTTVRVYEGVVEIEHGAVSVRVYAGQRWSRDAGQGELDTHSLDAIAREATLARAPAVEHAPAVSATPEAAPTAQASAVREDTSADSTPGVPRTLEARLATPSATEAEGLLRHGDAAGALALADAAGSRGEATPRWALVRADALRALGRSAEAADAYDTAARVDARHRAEAGYAAANLRFRALHDTSGALRSLDASGATGSSLAERALTLRVKLLRAEGREADARADATEYLTRFPEGTSAAFMQSVVGTPAE